MSDDLSSLTHFAGTTRLFPLPNLVLFPHVMQPLHIFEPRYRQMTADALASDRLITLTLLRPGWEADYEGKPQIHAIACLGRIVAEQRLDDGRFNILLRGLSRLRIVEEIPTAKPYRTARGELLRDCTAPAGKEERRFRRRLSASVVNWFPSQGAVLDQFRKLLKSELQLGPLADIIAFALPLDLVVKQELLEELDVSRRLRRLLDCMEAHPPKAVAAPATAERKFPPEFSVN
jgi:Lon protease-like protein